MASSDTSPMIFDSNGLGRDSMAILALAQQARLLVDNWPLALEDLAGVVFSDPGHEWPLTYKAGEATAEACREAGVPYYFLAKPPTAEVRAYEPVYAELWDQAMRDARRRGRKKWWEAEVRDRSVGAPWRRRKYGSIEEKAAAGGYHVRLPLLAETRLRGRTTSWSTPECTTSQKIVPIRELVSDLCEQRYGMTLKQWGRLVQRGKREPHVMIIGIAADEADRAMGWDPARGVGIWGIREVHPLIEMGITKHEESQILADAGWGWVHKSGCVGCHYSPVALFWILREDYPAMFAEIVQTERRSEELRRRLGDRPGMTLKGGKTTEQRVRDWGRSRLVLKAQYNSGNIDDAFLAKLAKLDSGFRRVPDGGPRGWKWAAKVHLTPDKLCDRSPRLCAELKELLLSKGYDRNCAFTAPPSRGHGSRRRRR